MTLSTKILIGVLIGVGISSSSTFVALWQTGVIQKWVNKGKDAAQKAVKSTSSSSLTT